MAEDLQNNEWITKDIGSGGAGFGSQWDAAFVHPIRTAIIAADDSARDMWAVRDALYHRNNGTQSREISVWKSGKHEEAPGPVHAKIGVAVERIQCKHDYQLVTFLPLASNRVDGSSLNTRSSGLKSVWP